MTGSHFAALLKDPLTHFLAIGALLFLFASGAGPAPTDESAIIVDRAALLTHIQFRSKAFAPGAAEAVLDGLSTDARKKLIADYVREEALDREAVALGLDAGDYVIRQRRVQKAEFLAEAAASAPEPETIEVETFYAENSERYRSPPAATLTHVFISAKDRPRSEARSKAAALLGTLKANDAGFEDALRYGERFLFHRNYVERTDDYIGSQLGPVVTTAIFADTSPLDEWQGPFSSDYGEHLIYVTARTPARVAPLVDVADVVRADLREMRRQEAIDEAIAAIVARYRVVDRLGAAR